MNRLLKDVIIDRDDYIRVCRKFCNKYDTSYYVDLTYYDDGLEKPIDKREVCKNCCYCDAEFLTGCNYPYMTN